MGEAAEHSNISAPNSGRPYPTSATSVIDFVGSVGDAGVEITCMGMGGSRTRGPHHRAKSVGQYQNGIAEAAGPISSSQY